MTEKKTKELVIRIAVVIYMIALTIFVSDYILKVVYTNLWDNQRIAMRMFISIGMMVSLMYFAISEKNILKMMFIYHFILIGTAVCIMVPLKFMPAIIIPMIITAIYDIKVGIISSVSVSATFVIGMGVDPLYVFSAGLIIILVMSCFAVSKFDRLWKNILGIVGFFVSEIILLLYFKTYCKNTDNSFAKNSFINSFILSIIIASLIYVLVANMLKIFVDKIVYKKTPAIMIKKLTSTDSPVVQLMRSKSASVYYHSNEVAEMARLAAKRIGADYNLAYAGGLFHDLGKVSGSEYIKEGLKLAEEYGIPGDIRTIMVEHNVKSRLPKSKEAAIVMLSDTVVSTIEYVKGTMDKKDISEQVLVENAINKRLTSGALNKSGLSIEEFNIIKETLINIKEQQ